MAGKKPSEAVRSFVDPIQRCGYEITGDIWHLGHDDYDRRIYRGPEHVRCNLRAAAAKTNRRKARRRSRPTELSAR